METGQAKLREMQNLNINTPEASPSSKSDSSTASSNFTFEADSLPPIGLLGVDLFELQQELLTKKIAEISLKYNNCFICLQETIAEEILLQDENLKLRDENLQLSLLVTAKEDEILASIRVSGNTPSDLLQPPSSSNQVSGERKSRSTEKKEVAEAAPRGKIPKAISVRSNEYLPVIKNKSSNTQSVDVAGDSKGIGSTGSSRLPHRLRLTAAKDGEGSKEVELELDVYQQGMTKTELCNKWEETGYCPYGDRCQFAHGVEELRPVLRHPKYKTELCRMVTSGGTCPYGHRCHFRHALDPNEEKEVVL